jgi:hypothetical protein
MTTHRPSPVLELPNVEHLFCLVCCRPWPCPDAEEVDGD